MTSLEITSSSNFYKLFKIKFERSAYISRLPTSLCKNLIRFCTRNHRLPVEQGRWHGIPVSDRKCYLCNKDMGDEFHYLFTCECFSNERQKYIKPYFYRRPNTLKLQQLLNTSSSKVLRNLCDFIDIIV